jgi:hypothetical protein
LILIPFVNAASVFFEPFAFGVSIDKCPEQVRGLWDLLKIHVKSVDLGLLGVLVRGFQ